MNRFLRLIILLQMVLTLTGEVCAEEPLPPSPPSQPAAPSPSQDPIKISADHIIQGSEKESIFAWGRVRVDYQDRILWADRVMINNVTGIGKAKGHVILHTQDGTRMKAKQTLFDIKSKQGKIFKGKGVVAKQFFITGQEINRLSQIHIKLREATLTTCEGVIPDWAIQTKFTDLINGDRALFTGGVVRIRNFPVLYLPVGYIPMNQERKTGFLLPTFGWSDLDGVLFNGAFFWAINQWSDATLKVDRSTLGTQPSLEYRYTPSRTTEGRFNGTFLESKPREGVKDTFWKINMEHIQDLPSDFKFHGVLDLESQDNLTKVLEDDVIARTRNHTDSYASIIKNWDNSSLDILARYRDSTDDTSDDTFGQLPNITYKLQSQQLKGTPLYYNMDTSAAWFVTDLNKGQNEDDLFKTARFDIRPQLTLPLALAPWASLTPTVGAKWTYYSQGLDPNQPGPTTSRLAGFSREAFNLRTSFEGPKINRIFRFENSSTKIKHLIEPGITHNYTPEFDEDDQRKIKIFDGVDSGGPQNSVTFGLNQRLLKKLEVQPNQFETRQILRFSVTQSFDIRESTIDKASGVDRRPFSDIRFDLDSRLLDSTIFNFDATFNHEDNLVNSVNFEAGIKPVDNFWIIMERRWTRNGPNFILGTLDLALKPGWRLQYSTRFDELTSTFRENDFSLLYDDPCKCWGFSFDIIDRQFRLNDTRRDETKFLWNIKLRGLGDLLPGGRSSNLLHRDFEETQFPDTAFKSQ